METRRTNFMRSVAMFVMALAVALTAVLTPLTVKAAEDDGPYVVASYTLKKGEKWTLVVYNAADNAKISYKTSKKSVATVSKKGVVAAKKPGSATITVTVKQGKDTYNAKVKIKVKKTITDVDRIKRVAPELTILYNYMYELAEANGLLKDVAEPLNACADVVDLANDVAKNPGSYSKQDIKDTLAAIEGAVEMLEVLFD